MNSNLQWERLFNVPFDEEWDLIELDGGLHKAVRSSDIAYIAGFFDGEGCVNFQMVSGSTVLRCDITNTNPQILIQIQSIFGGRINSRKLKENWKVAYHLIIDSRHAVRFLDAISPYLKLKTNQATIAFMWEFLRNERLEKKLLRKDQEPMYILLRRQLSWLNKKGVHSDPEPIEEVLQNASS